MPEQSEQIRSTHPLFSEKQLKSIKRDGREVGEFYRTPKPLRSPLFWETVKAAMILRARGYKEDEMLLFVRRDEEGTLNAASLIYQGKAVYPAMIEDAEELKKLGLEKDVPLSAALRQHASGVKRRGIRRSLQTQLR